MSDNVSAIADCECGYELGTPMGLYPSILPIGNLLLTEAFETDFLHLNQSTLDASHYDWPTSKGNGNHEDINIGWYRQQYTVSPRQARGPYGKRAEPHNVLANPLKNQNMWSGEGVRGGDAGLQIWVREPVDGRGMVSMGEIVSIRNDMRYGSFRVGMKLSGVNGTCAAFFWYKDNTHEIDMEFLSRQFEKDHQPVNLVVQSPQSREAGYNAYGTPGFHTVNLPFPKPAHRNMFNNSDILGATDAFHEYRIDWFPTHITFWADTQYLGHMDFAIPHEGGHLVLNHWSNGDPAWSGGPPERDAVITLSYVKAYFNSTRDDVNRRFMERCPVQDLKKVCLLPSVTQTLNGQGPETRFFTLQSAAGRMVPSLGMLLCLMSLVVGMVWVAPPGGWREFHWLGAREVLLA